jgi:hypothetical protein
MKKGAIILSVLAAVSMMTACGSGEGTYYPGKREMLSNLEDKGYEVDMKTTQKNGYSGIYLEAEKGDEYIDFYWLDVGSNVVSLETDLKEKHTNYAKLVGVEDDSKYGSLVFCSSANAMDDAGIEMVDVSVKVS